MSLVAAPLLLCVFAAAGDQPAPKLPLGKDTTYVTGPLDKDGYIDYEAAINERVGKGVTPERNANVLLWKALGPAPSGTPVPSEFFRRLGLDEPSKDGDYFIDYRAFLKDNLKLDPGQFDADIRERDRAGQRPWAAKDYPHVAAWLKANEKPLALIVEATRRPDYYSPQYVLWDEKRHVPTSVVVPPMLGCGEAADALAARAMLRVGEGKFDDAWQDLLACHRLGRLLDRGGTFTEPIVGIRLDRMAGNAELAYLERADLTAVQVRDRIRDLQSLPPTPPWADKVDVCQRFDFLATVEQIRRGGVDPPDYLSGFASYKLPDADLEKSMAAIDWAPALRNGNAWYDRMAAALRLKDRAERQKELDKIERDLKTLEAAARPPWNAIPLLLGKDSPGTKAGKLIGDRLIPVRMRLASGLQQLCDRDEQVQRNVQVAFALAAYRRDQGKYPARLGDLAPNYVAAVPDDLFSGKQLIYHPWDKGYVLYSVGANGKDDGGRTFDDDPRGDDLPVVMPLPPLKAKQ